MSLNQEILNQCNDFFKRIANKAGNKKLEDAIEELRQHIQDDVDGFTCLHDRDIARDTQEGLEGIWDLIDEEEKRNDPSLEEVYDAIGENLQDYSGYNRHENGRFQDFLKRIEDRAYLSAHEEEEDDWSDDEEPEFDEYEDEDESEDEEDEEDYE